MGGLDILNNKGLIMAISYQIYEIFIWRKTKQVLLKLLFLANHQTLTLISYLLRTDMFSLKLQWRQSFPEAKVERPLEKLAWMLKRLFYTKHLWGVWYKIYRKGKHSAGFIICILFSFKSVDSLQKSAKQELAQLQMRWGLDMICSVNMLCVK